MVESLRRYSQFVRLEPDNLRVVLWSFDVSHEYAIRKVHALAARYKLKRSTRTRQPLMRGICFITNRLGHAFASDARSLCIWHRHRVYECRYIIIRMNPSFALSVQ